MPEVIVVGAPMTRDEAIAQVATNCAKDAYPTLSDHQLGELVDGAQRYTTWEAATDYAYGALVVPSTGNGHLYRCLVAGTSGASEPTWPTYTAPDSRPGLTRPHWDGSLGTWLPSQVGDGTVQWLEAGYDDGQAYDVKLASYRGWRLKASLAAADHDFEGGSGQSYSRSQVFGFCQQMMRVYAPVRVA